ncbi:MAG TPA: glycosyltransferase family 39 protein, partial [Planctomycetota bacterium]|nr:glycosyltransferase family 39 protein [Planctomycetota bacterium]
MIEAEHPQDPKLPPGKPSPRDGTVLLFLALFGLLFSWSSWQRDFSDPDECLFAVIAGNMEAGSGWIVPRFAGEPFLELPPLAGWLAALLHRATGLDPLVSYRLPVTLAAVFGLWLTYCAGKKLFDGRVGFLALLIQASTYFYFRRSSWLDDDLYFAVSCQLALTAFALATRKGAGPLPGMLGWLGLAGAALSKSALLAFILVFGPLLFFLFLEGGLSAVTRGFRKMRSRRGILLFLLVAVPWYVAAGWKMGAELFDAHVLRGHLSRVLDSPIDKQLPSFYLIHLLLDFLPWTLFLPLGLLHAKDRLQRDGERLGLTWALFTLL